MKPINLNHPSTRKIVLLLLYGLILTFCLVFSYELRFDFNVEQPFATQRMQALLWIVPLQLAALYIFRQFDGLLSYFGVPDLLRLLYALLVSSLPVTVVWYSAGIAAAPPRSIIVVDLLSAFLCLSSLRLAFRMMWERQLAPSERKNSRVRRVAIIGAGDVGASLARELLGKRGLGLRPVVFLDDDKAKWDSRVHDIPVVGSLEKLLADRAELKLDEVIIAMPSASSRRIREVVGILQQARLRFVTVPSMEQLDLGTVKVTQLRSVDIEDLLGREPVSLEMDKIRQMIRGQVVMVTGAGGSIGAELCRQIANLSPARLLLVEQSEVALFEIEQELLGFGNPSSILPLIADILDLPRMTQILDRYRPALIFHAAAHKHVPMMESQPGEALKNNVVGTFQLAELAARLNVGRFLLISTDKAINPTSVMGASKRLAELFVQAIHAENITATKFMAVRFGNVLGSSGSVIPIFTKQIAAGGPVRVTHPEMTRYFMTIPEAVMLVLQSCALAEGGEIFVLDMGKPVKISDLARQLIELSGFKVDEDIEIQYTGLRPGEKMFEEISHVGEHIGPTGHPKILRFLSHPRPLADLKAWLASLSVGTSRVEANHLKLKIQEAVPEYNPFLSE